MKYFVDLTQQLLDDAGAGIGVLRSGDR